jgi:carbonic anhydrase/acetyltransferase-like protein (isoleucine patch superfamily)
MSVRIHPTAIVEDGVQLGDGTSVWDNVHIRGPARLGRSCIVGGKSYIAYGVTIVVHQLDREGRGGVMNDSAERSPLCAHEVLVRKPRACEAAVG